MKTISCLLAGLVVSCAYAQIEEWHFDSLKTKGAFNFKIVNNFNQNPVPVRVIHPLVGYSEPFKGGYTGQYDLVFFDEFNDAVLDSTKWLTILSRHGDPDNRVMNGVVKPPRSLPYYYSYQDDPRDVQFSGTSIELLMQEMPAADQYQTIYKPGVGNVTRRFDYSAGQIQSSSLFKHGFMEARCKMPPSMDGIWLAFWLFFNDTEIDIFEMGQMVAPAHCEGQDINIDNDVWHLTYHDWDKDDLFTYGSNAFAPPGGHASEGVALKALNFDFVNEWHTYGLYWDDYKMIWTLDGTVIYTVYHYEYYWDDFFGQPSSGPWPVNSYEHLYALQNTLQADYEATGLFSDIFNEFIDYLTLDPPQIRENIGFPKDPGRIVFSTDVINHGGLYNVDPALDNTCTDNDAVFPNKMEVDWIRVYADKNCGSNVELCNYTALPTHITADNITLGGQDCKAWVMSYNQGLQELDDVTAVGSNEIILKPGFHAQNGSRFVAKIEDCASVNLRVRNTTPRDSITDKIRAIVHQADSITLAEQNQIRTSDTLLNTAYRNKVESVNIYPNPTTGEFTVQLADSEPAQIRVYNSLSSMVLVKEVFTTATIDLGAYRKGIYYVEVQQNQLRYSEKLVHH